MGRDEFLTIVEQGVHADRPTAERATDATLRTLAERIAPGESRDLALALPPELAPLVATIRPAERFGVDEFIRRVAKREGVDEPTAERHAAAVFTALGQAVEPREIEDVIAELPTPEFARLLPRGPSVEIIAADEFERRVAERAGLDQDGARRAIDAVLETLAERIAGGEVQDLLVRLPIELHPPLRRGDERTSAQPTRMSFDEFLRRVAEREGGDTEPLTDARAHSRAVLATLREAVGDSEFFDVTDQLPHEYDVLISR
jgi:uncharacterized protein (DUF2267 family)